MIDKKSPLAPEDNAPSDFKPNKRKRTGGRVKYTDACALCNTTQTDRWYRKYYSSGVICRSCYGKQRNKDPEVRKRRQEDARRWNNTNHYKQAIRSANRGKHQINLTEEEYLKLIEQPCFYCHGPLPKAGTKLDRVDSSRGYEVGNVVPCCKWCNVAKNNYTQEYFIEMCKRVAEIHK